MPKPNDSHHLSLIRQTIDGRPTHGYGRIIVPINRYLREKGQSPVNHKKIYRIMRINHLLLPKYTQKPTRTHDGSIITLKSSMRGCSGVFKILCYDGEKLRVISSMDTSDRDALSHISTTGGITSDIVKDLLVSSLEYRFCKIHRLPHKIQ